MCLSSCQKDKFTLSFQTKWSALLETNGKRAGFFFVSAGAGDGGCNCFVYLLRVNTKCTNGSGVAATVHSAVVVDCERCD